MKQCIICRKDKQDNDFSDEHVIPDSINGYYHIFSVCKDCNSKLGTNVDSKLVNHKFIDFQRELLKIEGKSGTIPNPFEGTHTLKDDPNQKVTMTFDENRQLIPKLLPKTNISQSDNGVTNISLTLDKKDLGQKDTIIKKMLKRNDIDVSKVTIQEQIQEYSERPCVKTTMQIDIQDFKIGLLKIAYEFTVDTINSYFNDPIAISISKILYEADMSKMEQEIIFLGDGLNKEILKPFSKIINIEDNNHYLILAQFKTSGLICFINIFDCFALGILMSRLSYSDTEDNIIIGTNDIKEKRFYAKHLADIIQDYP